MNILLRSTSTALFGLALAWPMSAALAQGNLVQCSAKYRPAELPCRMAGGVAREIEEWRILDLIRRGDAKNTQEARAIIAARRGAKVTGTRVQPEMPRCGPRVQNTPLPCTMAGRVANSRQDWAILDLIRRGEASNVQEARAILEGGRITGTRVQPDVPRCGPQVENTPLPCVIAGRQVTNANEWQVMNLIATGQAATVREARRVLQQRRIEAERAEAARVAAAEAARVAEAEAAALRDRSVQTRGEAQETRVTPSAQACAAQVALLRFPCLVNGNVAADQLEWQILTMVANGDAANNREARAILRQRRAERATAAATDAGAATSTPSVTERVTQDKVRQSDEEFATSVTAAGRDSSGSGLSKFEQALLLGLGAVVVGSVLKNGDKVVSRSGDRVVVESPTGALRVLKDDEALVRRPGDSVQTQNFADGSTRIVVSKPDGSQVITVRGRDGAVLQRVNVDPQGNRYVIIDDTVQEQEVIVRELPKVVRDAQQASNQTEDTLRRALVAEMQAQNTRRFSLRQVREIAQVRALAPELELDAVRFESGSAAIRPAQARALANLGGTLRRLVAEDPRTVLLIEGHTDAVGDESYNLALSDRRAETVALALTEYFDVPPANLVTQGYGETALKVLTLDSEVANRRAVVRNISALLR